VPIVLKSGSLNLLEPSGPVKGCDWIALPFGGNDPHRGRWVNMGIWRGYGERMVSNGDRDQIVVY
jgi:hypothetical protein